MAFFVLTFTDSPLLYQIGWVVPLGLLFCLITILWALPAWLVWLERYSWAYKKGSMRLLGMDKLGGSINRRPGIALCCALLILALVLPGLFRVRFESDPYALRPKGLEALEVQQKIAKAFGAGREYVLVAWPSRDVKGLFQKGLVVDEALAKAKEDGNITTWASISKLGHPEPYSIKGVDLEGIDDLFKKYGLGVEDFTYVSLFLTAIRGDRQAPKPSIETSVSPCDALDQLPPFFSRYFMCEKDAIMGIAWVRVSGGHTPLMLKKELSRSFPDLIIVNPRLAVRELLGEVGSGLWTTVGWAAFFVLLILGAFFRRPSSVLLSLLPMAMGLLATIGILGWTGVPINIFNFIVLPILLGIGLDDGIHIFRRYQESGDVERTLATTGRSVFITTLTTACGFGSLYLAQYHVLESMGLMTIVGVFACFFFSVVALPAILRMKKPG
jgi:predicted RND superfamily exporter protein